MHVNRSILIVVSTLTAGGAERAASEIANAWAMRGSRVALLTISSVQSDHYRLHANVMRIAVNLIWDSKGLWDALLSNLRRSFTLRREILRFRPDVVITFADQTNMRVLAAMLGTGTPVIVSERIDPRVHRISRGWSLARRLLYPFSAALVVQTRSVASWAVQVVHKKKVRVIPNFVRAMNFVSSRTNGHYLLAMGRLDAQKGFDLLLKAYAASSARELGFRLKIVGVGHELGNLTALGRQLGIEGYLDFPGASLTPEVEMMQATMFVLSSRFEGFPNVLVEAMALGCAVIATDCPSGPAEIITDGRDGLLVPTEDIAALTRALDRLLKSPELRKKLGDAATEIRCRLSIERVLEKWDAVVEEVSARGGPR